MDNPANPEPVSPCARPSPIDAPSCPLCGQANACAPARTGAFSQPCWCESVEFSAELLAQVPERLRNKACICRACAARKA